MKQVECEGCGAPLVLHRHDCEYCRRIHTQPDPLSSLSTDYLRQLASQRYATGWNDPRSIYGQQMQNNSNPLSQLAAMNSQGQAAADHYNAMNSAWSGIGGGRPNGWLGGL